MKKLLARWLESTSDPARMRLKQRAFVGGVLVLGVIVVKLLMTGSSEVLKEEKAEDRKTSTRLNTPFEAVNPQDVWASRIESQAEAAKTEAQKVRDETKLLNQKIDALEKLFQNIPPSSKEDLVSPEDKSFLSGSFSKVLEPPPVYKAPSFSPPEIPLGAEKPAQALSGEGPKEDDLLFGASPSPRIFHAHVPEGSRALLKNIDNYVPAGSYARAALTSGVVASTALQASSHPQPIVLRLVDDGHLPRGFHTAMRDNVLIGACYGDLSSERVMCRLETISWVQEDGVTVEKKVEGWVIGEDGRPGLRGEVVDRSGEAVRDTLIAGMLSGLGQFLKSEATSRIYPVSPFGQTNALKGKQALEGAASSGASNALDKLADFSIKRAEQMQPVILIASGRVVDIVFEKGVDMRPESVTPSLTLIDQKNKEKSHDENF